MTETAILSSSTSLRIVTFDFPLKVGNATIESVQVRKPASGELRGTTMMALSQLDYTALETLLPRITTPQLTKHDIGQLDPADFMQLGGEVMDFLLPKSAKDAASPTT
ncbi:phage tail assembly protein [Sphingomonas sp. Leaf242]|uniref:phage tail assembly protein n=1 Tax=Sphingomonas sp. Leaf242 TaxID=1736304 RepID=UPI000714B03C|nr:phage tail assembly protein [Sphingomonas sp. Leaf242]KQO07866.1 phage tail protein [Sphingomonas sp. Leaf242]